MTGKTRRRASRANRFGMAVIAAIVAVLIVVLLVRSNALRNKINMYTQANAQLNEEITGESERADEISKLPEYIQSDAYIEKTAREKFGLVYKDEIIFRSEKK